MCLSLGQKRRLGMSNSNWRKKWANPFLSQCLLDGSASKFVVLLDRPNQVACEIVEAMPDNFASYSEISDICGYEAGTVSDCLRSLANGGFPIIWDKSRRVKKRK